MTLTIPSMVVPDASRLPEGITARQHPDGWTIYEDREGNPVPNPFRQDPGAPERSGTPLLGQLRKRRKLTKDDYLKAFGLITLVSGTIAGFLVSLALGFAVLAALSALFALAVYRLGEDE